jgi:hypothetical protein
MEFSEVTPAILRFRNRTLILVLAPPLAVFCSIRILANLRSGEPWLNWLMGLVMWLFLLILALRRRLVLTQQGLEYTELFTTAHVPWAQVTGLVSRKTLGIWPVEGLQARTQPPRPKELFIDLTQFNRSWRHDPLGTILRGRLPHLFQESALKQTAA